MRLTIVPEDKTVIVEGQGLNNVLFSSPNNIRALQWYGTRGVVEYTDYSNSEIAALPQWAVEAKAAYDEALIALDTNPQQIKKDYEIYLENLHAQYPEANNKSIQAILNKNYPGFTYSPMLDYRGRRVIGIMSGLMIGEEGLSSFHYALKIMRKLGVPVFSYPYPENESTYESFKTFLEAEGMVVYESTTEDFRYTYLPWNLDMAKARKKTQIGYDIEETLESSGFEYNGRVYDVDEKARTVISQKATQLSVSGYEGVVYWRLLDNSTAAIPSAEFIEMAIALTSYVESLYANSWQRKAQADAATTEEELDNI